MCRCGSGLIRACGVVSSGVLGNEITAPTEPGKYRVLLVTRDTNNGAATHSISSVVER